ncbi:hypothetical protein JZ751_013541 [Albula glossodonta]|uniref:PX domain-containing protein n=1 Tax=Albula glossodonta TaxID=121402 RepID=A0A8T2MZ95_9TELE|nr:hypothetical protein JZ751_013541 [Albula glossodonta]
MATPFVPVAVPIGRPSPGGSRPRPHRTASLGSASSSGSSIRGPGDEGVGACQTPPLQCQSPVARARLNGNNCSMEYSSIPRPHGDGGSSSAGSGDSSGLTESERCRSHADVMAPGAELTDDALSCWARSLAHPSGQVYKILVKKTQDDSWVVFRRYTDFSRLNDKRSTKILSGFGPGRLSVTDPLLLPPSSAPAWGERALCLSLGTGAFAFRHTATGGGCLQKGTGPPRGKQETGYGEDCVSCQNRGVNLFCVCAFRRPQLGLQVFLQNLVAHKDIANCVAVREFLCLDDPPGPFDSLEESRAFCETLEECNYRLQKELTEKQREMASLRKELEEKELHIRLLEERMRYSCVCVCVCVCVRACVRACVRTHAACLHFI